MRRKNLQTKRHFFKTQVPYSPSDEIMWQNRPSVVAIADTQLVSPIEPESAGEGTGFEAIATPSGRLAGKPLPSPSRSPWYQLPVCGNIQNEPAILKLAHQMKKQHS